MESSASSLHQLTESVTTIAATVRAFATRQQIADDAEELQDQQKAVGWAAQLGLLVQLLVVVYMGLAYGKLWEIHGVRGAVCLE